MKKRLLLVIPGILLVAASVFGILWLTKERIDYAGALNYVSEILKSESTIHTYLDNTSTLNYDHLDTASLNNFQTSVNQISSYYESLSASTALKDNRVSEQYDNLENLPKILTKILSTQELLTAYTTKVATDGYVSATEELAALKNSENPFIVTLAADLSTYLAKVSAFNEKYQNAKSDQYDAMLQDQTSLTNAGKDLEAKYAKTTLKDIFDITPADITGYFSQLKSLELYLKEKL